MKARQLPTQSGPWTVSHVRDLRQALRQHLSLAHQGSLIPPGFHHVSFNRIVEENQLCEDGAERSHAPSDAWKFRVWAGGHMGFDMPRVHVNTTKFVKVSERITDVRVVGDPARDDSKIFVTLTKWLRASLHKKNDDTDIDTDTSGGSSAFASMIREQKHLCFMRDVPPSLKAAGSTPRRLPPPTEPFHSQTMTPSRTLLFRFSALSQNAHAIHLDADFTRRVYGIPDLLVQGPLTSVLMLEVLRKALRMASRVEDGRFSQDGRFQLYSSESDPDHNHVLAVREFEYRNLLPLFVDEPITIACKRAVTNDSPSAYNSHVGGSEGEGGWPASPGEKWDVWIQKGQGDNAMLAVKGKALVQPVRVARRPGKRMA
ncbi:hypothetical protein A1O3_00615 [Capronia epimyces CBS 606.96]|uniref:MaoC-like domain-containing protein n=1 Tax=Capronia epimyces CBS 606.96 TaxID=1182542 RepID=W9YQX3_9EURO|nr:uncharacterized protein A1O3_00615 [Capronia epimyces CBS 606.96]EXJ92065.1 hypothetical protein A1O3_00615 [Capronia epimyces CBS 606.96]